MIVEAYGRCRGAAAHAWPGNSPRKSQRSTCFPGYHLRKADSIPKSNILINNNGRACLAGFSLLTPVPDELVDPRSNTTLSTDGIWWPAPEVLDGRAPSKETDIFSLSMVMIEVRRE